MDTNDHILRKISLGLYYRELDPMGKVSLWNVIFWRETIISSSMDGKKESCDRETYSKERVILSLLFYLKFQPRKI